MKPFHLSIGCLLVIGVYVDIQFYSANHNVKVVSNHFSVVVLMVFLAVITKTRIHDF